MRKLTILMAFIVSACLPPDGDDGAPDNNAPTFTVTPAPDDLVLPDAEASEDGTPKDADPPTEPAPKTVTVPVPLPKSQAQLACEKRDGRWAKAGQVGNICYLPQSDANTSCDSADDCNGACLARSRTCAPISPLMGCHEILTRSGAVATQCRTF